MLFRSRSKTATISINPAVYLISIAWEASCGADDPLWKAEMELQQGVELLIGKAKVHRRGMRWLERRLVAVAEGA